MRTGNASLCPFPFLVLWLFEYFLLSFALLLCQLFNASVLYLFVFQKDAPVRPPGVDEELDAIAFCLLVQQEVVELVVRKNSPLIVEWDRYYPEGHITSGTSCVSSRLRATPCPALEAATKGKNVKTLESGHRPCNTEPQVVVRVSRRDGVAIRYPHASRIAVPATATTHPVRTTVFIRIRLR